MPTYVLVAVIVVLVLVIIWGIKIVNWMLTGSLSSAARCASFAGKKDTR